MLDLVFQRLSDAFSLFTLLVYLLWLLEQDRVML